MEIFVVSAPMQPGFLIAGLSLKMKGFTAGLRRPRPFVEIVIERSKTTKAEMKEKGFMLVSNEGNLSQMAQGRDGRYLYQVDWQQCSSSQDESALEINRLNMMTVYKRWSSLFPLICDHDKASQSKRCTVWLGDCFYSERRTVNHGDCCSLLTSNGFAVNISEREHVSSQCQCNLCRCRALHELSVTHGKDSSCLARTNS